MNLGYEVSLGGITSSRVNAYARNRPDIPYPERDIEEKTIPGRNGVLHIDNGRKKGIDIEIEFNYICDEDKWFETWRHIGRWLSQKNARLCFSDDKEFFYVCYYVTVKDNSRTSTRIGNFKATFHCAPSWYAIGGDAEGKLETEDVYLVNSDGELIGNELAEEELFLENSANEIIWDSDENTIKCFEDLTGKVLSSLNETEIVNEYCRCRPTYRIIGNGKCYLAVNDGGMEMSVDGYMIIDTERRIAYKEEKNLSHMVKGDYDDISLKEGANRIALDGGFEAYITPNWRVD